jgi:hypothetical protein
MHINAGCSAKDDTLIDLIDSSKQGHILMHDDSGLHLTNMTMKIFRYRHPDSMSHRAEHR